jgi:hypothetical protein
MSSITNIKNAPNIIKILFGVPQSQYAAIAFIISCIVFTTVFVLNNSNITLSDKIVIIFIAFIVSVPGLALALLQLTCIVTGAGANNTQWWCNIYAWILSIIIIFYSICLIVSVFIPLNTYNNIFNISANNKLNNIHKDTFADINIVNNIIKGSSSNINTINPNINSDNVGSNLLPFEYSDQLTFADILNNSR